MLFARRLLTLALVLQLPFLVVIALRQTDLFFHLHLIGDKQLPKSVTGLTWVGSSLLAIAGFTLVCRQLSLWEGHLEQTALAQRTRVLGSRKIAAGLQFFFYFVFLVPVFNLVPVLWARAQASSALADLAHMIPARRR